jgi:hypothetical protein
MGAALAAAVLVAVVGLNWSVAPSYGLITRPTPTPTLGPLRFGDPRLNTRTVSFAQAQQAASFKILRPAAAAARDPDSVMLFEVAGRIVSIRQTYTITGDRGVRATSVWLTQAPNGNPFAPPASPSAAVTRTVDLAMHDGRHQPATLTQTSFGEFLSWTDIYGYFSLRVPDDSFPLDRLIGIATSLR